MNNYSNGEFTIEEVERVNGDPLKKTGINQYQGPCRYCREEGGDTKGDNLHFNPTKGIFCGACCDNEHGKKLAQAIIKERHQGQLIYKQVAEAKYEEKELQPYVAALLKNKEMLELLKENTGLREEVIKECQIGFDNKNNVFLLPMIALDGSKTGYEIRVSQNAKGTFKFLIKTRGYADNIEKCLSKINSPKSPQNAIICAGYKDGYAVYQYLKDLGKENDYQILTNTNGEGNTARALKPHIDYLKQFQKVIICLDNDGAGKKATHKVEQEIPIIFYNLNLGKLNGINEYINDFTDLYKYIKANKITEDVIDLNITISANSILKIYLKHTNIKLDMPKKIEIQKEHYEIMDFFERGIYPFKGSYYSVVYNPDEHSLTYARKSNFVINILRTIIFNTLTFENVAEYRLEVTTNIGNKITKSKILTQKDLLELKNLHDILKEGGVHLHCLKDTELKNIVLEELNNLTEELYIYKNPSFVTHKNHPYWMYKNAAIDLETGNVLLPKTKDKNNTKNIIVLDSKNSFALEVDRGMYAPELYIPNLTYEEFIEENKDDELITEFSKEADSIESLIAKCLFFNTLRTYNNKVEALLTLGTAIMSPFVDIIFDKTMGYPINFMYGEAASGKSNLLQTIAYLFGFDSRFLSSGNDTAMNLLHNMEYYKNIPILYAEIEGYMRKNFETTVKAVYDRNSRKRMQPYGKEQDIRAINGTLNFASNDRAHRNPQTVSRLVYTEFYKDNFNPEEASKINKIREKYLSCIMPEVLKNYSDKNILLTMFENSVRIVSNLNNSLDLRCINNIAIAMTGMQLLFNVAKFSKDYMTSEPQKLLMENFSNYVKAHQDITHTENCFEKFLLIFLTLAKSNKITYGSEYVFNVKKKEISIYVEGMYQLFCKEFKQSEAYTEIIPSAKDIRNQATKESYISYANKYFCKKLSPRALIIQVPDDNAQLIYILNELEKIQEELAQKEHQKDKPIQTQYMIERAGEIV